MGGVPVVGYWQLDGPHSVACARAADVFGLAFYGFPQAARVIRLAAERAEWAADGRSV